MAAVAVRDRRWDHVAFFAVLYPSMAAGMALVPEDWPMWKALALAAGVVAAAKAAQVLVHRKIREAL